MTTPIPALVVSGFLGSGKTTLVRNLLAAARFDGARLAIISNEFGDVGIDKALLGQSTGGLVELEGGCVCCRLSDELGETVKMLIETAKPDRLVIETSGVALPGEMLLQFWRPPLDELISEEMVVVLVDGEYFLRERPTDDTFEAQIEAADLIVLNKCDLLEPSSVEYAVARLKERVGDKPILPTYGAWVPPDLLFPPDPEGLRKARRDPNAEPEDHTHDEFVTTELVFPPGVYESEVRWRVLAEGALRAKGFVITHDGLRLVQALGPRIEIDESPVEPPADRIGRVVIIKRRK